MALGLSQRINSFAQLGEFLTDYFKEQSLAKTQSKDLPSHQELDAAIEKAYRLNSWFIPENQEFALKAWAKTLNKQSLEAWTSKYDLNTPQNPKTVAVVMAGNIPLVGFHDVLSVLISGHKALLKLSSNDTVLIPFLTKVLIAINPLWEGYITFSDGQLTAYDAVIATGSNNSARYFEHYFSGHPNIIRKNRNAVAVLSGDESEAQLANLGEDIFRYFGLGCRNVSKAYVPKDFDLDRIFKALYPWNHLLEIKKYENNYDYNKTVFLMSQFDFLENGFFMLKQDESFSSPIACLFYERYESVEALKEILSQKDDEIQCIVGTIEGVNGLEFGQAQCPKLSDYADGVDTLEFLLKLG